MTQKTNPFSTVLADPPWPERGAGKIKRGADRHYSLMSVKDIESFLQNIPFADNCHFYMWVTNNYLYDGLKILDNLGFRYITNIAWIKDRIGLGFYFRGQHELLLFAVKGKTLHPKKRNQSTVISAKRRKHSQKPEEQYTKIEAVSPGPYLEVFARNKREGWEVIGNEVQDSIHCTVFRIPFGT